WTLASVAAGRLVVPLGPALTGRLGGAFALLGGLLYLLLTPARGPWWVAMASLVVGFGMGFIMTTTIVTIQSSVAWQRRGTATATNMLMRILGNSVGAALLGGVLNLALGRAARALPGGGADALARIEASLTDRKSTRLNSSHVKSSYGVFCLKKKATHPRRHRPRGGVPR